MSLDLYIHPLASFCHKVLIAFYENATAFRPITVDLQDPGSAGALLAKWPVGKIPVLHDTERGRVIPETSIIIEYVQQHYPGPAQLLPQAEAVCLDARLWERFFDLYVSVPMQKIVLDRLRSETDKDPSGVAEARSTLDTAYAMIDAELQGKEWFIAERFSIVECSATPALFYALIVHPLDHDSGLNNLKAYFDRLMHRPSVQRTLREARPFFGFFPYRDQMPEKFLHD
jgi:glutathione S-transferase